jgi:hypothetical protein
MIRVKGYALTISLEERNDVFRDEASLIIV